MKDNVVDLKTAKKKEDEKKPEGLDPNMVMTLAEFTAIMETYDAKAFAAVAINKEGNVIDTWYTAMPHCALIGSIEMLKNDYLMNQWLTELDEES